MTYSTSFTTTVNVAMMESMIYASAATVSVEDASIGMVLAGLPGRDTNEKHPKVAIRQIMSSPISLLDIGIAGL
jgi:hypothetical protein